MGLMTQPPYLVIRNFKTMSCFFKVTPLILASEGQNNESYRGVGPSKKEEKFPTEGGGP